MKTLTIALLCLLLSSCASSTPPSSDEIVQSFKDKGLEVGTPRDVDDDSDWASNLVPKTYTEGTHFDVGKDQGGQVLVFKEESDKKVMQSYWEDLNSKGGNFYSHVYERPNALLHINGKLSKGKADEYNEVFQNT